MPIASQPGNAKTQTHDRMLDSNKTQRYSKIPHGR